MAAEVRIGTSGWEYRHWAGRFYPKALPRDRWFEFYADAFDTVELNNPFYRLPTAEIFGGWAEQAPHDFRYAVKASRYLTHLKRLREPGEPLERLWTRALRLGVHLGPMLYQLPPRWKPNPERLSTFLAAVPRDRPQTIEFRDRRWYRPDMIGLLTTSPVALCLHDMPGSAWRTPIGPLVYVRFHGAGERYGGSYSPQALTAWADRIAGWSRAGIPVWAYFNNDGDANAVRDAVRLRDLVGRRSG